MERAGVGGERLAPSTSSSSCFSFEARAVAGAFEGPREFALAFLKKRGRGGKKAYIVWLGA